MYHDLKLKILMFRDCFSPSNSSNNPPIVIFTIRVIFMNPNSPPLKKNQPFSKSLKKMMGMTSPISPECTKYLQRTHSEHMKASFNLPTLLTSGFKCNTNKNRSSTYLIKRELSEQSKEEKV